LVLSEHAAVVIAERGLALAWIEAAIAEPDTIGPDPASPDVTRAWKRIPEAGGRVVRVVYRPLGNDILVITAFFDRKARR